MNNFNTITLNLIQPIIYNKETVIETQDIESLYQLLIKKLDNNGVASEACINIEYINNDNISFKILEAGFASTPTDDVIEAVKKGKEIPLFEHDMEIVPGKYKFIQLPFLPTQENLFATLMQISCSQNFNQKGSFYLRLLKENSLVILAQVILKLKE